MTLFVLPGKKPLWRAQYVPTDFEEKEREEDAKAAPLHLDSLRKSIVGKPRYKAYIPS